MGFALKKTDMLPAVKAAAELVPAPAKFVDKQAVASPKDPLLELPADLVAKARERLRFVQEVRGSSLPAASACHHISRHPENYPILATAGKGKSSALTYANYTRWLSKLGLKRGKVDTDNLLALVDAYKGKVATPIPDAFEKIFCKLYLDRARLSVSEAHHYACQQWRLQVRPAPAPTYDRMVDFVAALTKDKPNAVILAREGDEALRNQNGDFITRDWSPYPAGSVLIADNRQLDFFCRSSEGKAVRPFIVAFLCPITWKFVWTSITDKSPDSDLIQFTMYQAIRAMGNQPPDYLYIDNGKDFCAKGFVTPVITPDGTEHSICRSLGIIPKIALPYNARAKVVEPAFKRISKGFDKIMPAYCGELPQWRDRATVEYFRAHPEELPSIGQVQQALDYWMREHYDTRPRPGARTDKRAPGESFAAREPRPMVSDELLSIHFAKPIETRTIGRGGRIECDSTYRTPELRDYIGQKLMICRRAWDDSLVVVRELNGRHICLAQKVEVLDALNAAPDDLSDRMRSCRILDSAAKRQVKELRGESSRHEIDITPIINRISDGCVSLIPATLPQPTRIVDAEPVQAPRNPELDAMIRDMENQLYPPKSTSHPQPSTELEDLQTLLKGTTPNVY